MRRTPVAFLAVLALSLAGCAPRPTEEQARRPAVIATAAATPPSTDEGNRMTANDEQDPSATPPTPLPEPPEPAGVGLVLEAAPRYVIGFPLFVSVIYDARATWGHTGLPDLVPWVVPDVRVGFRFSPVGGGPDIVNRAKRHERPTSGLMIKRGEVRRGLVDLSNRAGGFDLRPGRYRLSLLIMEMSKERESPSVPVELVAPSPAEARESARLRASTGDSRATDHGYWWPFLALHWETPVVSPALGAEATAQLGLLLFFHRAIYGPEPAGVLDPARLRAVTGPHLAAEALALRLEMAVARGDPGAPALRQALSRWPGMDHRIAAIDAGEGFITHARKFFGAEGPLAARFPKLPYTP